MLIYISLFECGRNLLFRLDVTYEQACMSTPKEKFRDKMLETIVDEKNRNGALLFNEKLWQSVSKLLEEKEA